MVYLKNLGEHPALNFSVSIIGGKEYIKSFAHIHKSDEVNNRFEEHFGFSPIKPDDQNPNVEALFEVKYQDIHKNKYIQKVLYYAYESVENIIPHLIEME